MCFGWGPHTDACGGAQTVINAGKQQGSPTAVSKAYRVFQLMNATSRTPRMYTAMISALGQVRAPAHWPCAAKAG